LFEHRGSLGWVVIISLLLSIVVEAPLLAQSSPKSLWSALNPDPIVAIDPPEQVVDAGDTFSVKVVIEQAVDLGGYEFTIGFDHSIVEVLDVEVGDFIGSVGCTVIPLGPDLDEAGTATFGAVTVGCPTGPEGTGDLATVSLKALGEGNTDLALYKVMVFNTSGSQVAATVHDGRVQVGAGTPAAGATATPTGTPTTTAIETPTKGATVEATPTRAPTAAMTGTPAEQAAPETTATWTKTPRGAASPTATPSATLTLSEVEGLRASSEPAEATTEAPEPTSTSTTSGVEEGATVTEAPPATPPATPASEGEPTATEKPAGGNQAASGSSAWLVGGAVALAIVGIVAIVAGVALLASRRSKRS